MHYAQHIHTGLPYLQLPEFHMMNSCSPYSKNYMCCSSIRPFRLVYLVKYVQADSSSEIGLMQRHTPSQLHRLHTYVLHPELDRSSALKKSKTTDMLQHLLMPVSIQIGWKCCRALLKGMPYRWEELHIRTADEIVLQSQLITAEALHA